MIAPSLVLQLHFSSGQDILKKFPHKADPAAADDRDMLEFELSMMGLQVCLVLSIAHDNIYLSVVAAGLSVLTDFFAESGVQLLRWYLLHADACMSMS